MPENSNDRLITDLTDMLAGLQTTFGALTDVRRQHAALTESASVERGRITVVVNASGAVVETQFSDDIDDLSYGEIARATVQAAQQAAAKAAAASQELTAPLRALRSRMLGLRDMAPRLLDRVPGLQDLRGEIPPAPAASLLPPAMRENPTVGLEFEDVVEYESGHHSVRDR